MTKHTINTLATITIIAVLSSCNGRDRADSQLPATPTDTIHLKYAKGFKVHLKGITKLVEVTYPFQGATSGYSYLLVPHGEQPPSHDDRTQVIFTPLKSIVCTSTTHIPLLDYLGETDKLVGFPTTDYISSQPMRKRIDSGNVVDLGIDKELNLERLAVLHPGALMGYTMTGDFGQFRKVEALGVPVIINGEYLEQHPLGRAEWLKFMALFFNREKEADSVFNVIEKNYLDAKAALGDNASRPSVLSGIVYGDAWFLPGGQNYAAKLFNDAGCKYPWADTESNGYLQLPFESVYAKARNADLWIGTGGYKTLNEIKAADARYARFEPFIKKQIFNYDARQGSRGGNEFLELGYLRPDLILKDLIKISHPSLLPHHTLYFHRKLE